MVYVTPVYGTAYDPSAWKKEDSIVFSGQIHEYKYEFNVRLLALRDKKIRTIEEIRRLVKELMEVQKDLNPSRRVPVPDVPEMHLEEMPEKYVNGGEPLLLFPTFFSQENLYF